MRKERCSVCKNMMGNSLSKNNKGQPTHTKCKTIPMQKEEWENEFDMNYPLLLTLKEERWFKSFIRKLLQEKGEEMIEELKKELSVPESSMYFIEKIIKRIMQ